MGATGTGAHALLVGLLLATAGLAGCLGSDAGEEPGPPDANSTPDGDDETGADDPGSAEGGTDDEAETTPATPSGPVERTLYFDQGPALSSTVPDAGTVSIPGGPSGILVDRPLITFQSDPLEQATVLEAEPVTVDLWIEVDAPQPSNGEFDLVLWLGSTRGLHLVELHALDGPVLQNEGPVHVTFELAFDDARSFVVPAGEQLVAELAASQTGEEASLERLHVGGEMLSSLNLTQRVLAEDPTAGLADASAKTLSGTVPASVNPTECRMQDGVSSIRHDIEIPPNATALELTLNGGDRSPHNEDLDLHVHAEDGSIVLRTVSLRTDENMILAGPTLDGLRGSTLGAMVVACNDVAKDYTVDVRQV